MDHLIAFLRGVWEFRRNWTWADPERGDDGMTALDDSYDLGREYAHRVTFRQFEEG